MTDSLRDSLAKALGVEPANGAEALPAPVPVPARQSRLDGFTSLRLPEPCEHGVGDFRARQRERENRDLTTPSALIRKAVEDWPEQSARVAALAAALAVPKGEAWRRVIVAGIAALADEIGGPE